MYIDFHTHGKLAKYLPFSTEYTNWLLSEARSAGLDAICLTEHFNTIGFDEVYAYIAKTGEKQGDSYVFDGLKVFPGMETDIAEGGHVLSIGPMDAIRELNKRLEPYKKRGCFLPFAELSSLFAEYPVIVGAGHPYREGGHIPELSEDELQGFDFIDLNGKDVAEDRYRTERLTYSLSVKTGLPVVGGSDTHQAVQYGCIRNNFKKDVDRVSDILEEMKAGNYDIVIHPEAAFKVKTAGLLKRALKEVDAWGGDYVSILTQDRGETAAVIKMKKAAGQ